MPNNTVSLTMQEHVITIILQVETGTHILPRHLHTITLTETVSYEGTTYSLDEVRIKAVGGTVAIAQDLDDSTCTDLDGLRMIQITAGANCNGVYRAKEIIIPENKWHSTIFDYVIFNGEGSI